MADVNTLPGVTEQLKLVTRLRWQLLRNGLRRKGNRLDFAGILIAAIVAGSLVLSLCIAFFVGGKALVSGHHVPWLALLFWAIFLWWQIVPIFAAGFGANFEFRNLLRFPLRLSAFYILSLGYGLADFAALSSLSWLASMTLGVAIANIRLLPAMLAVTSLFLLLNLTLERLIGSWAERIFAKRRAREFLIGAFVFAMVSLNFLNPAFQRWGNHGARPHILKVWPYLSWLPASLAGRALAFANSGSLQQFGFALFGLLLWTSAITALLWLRCRSLYFGEELSESRAPALANRKQRRTLSSNLPNLLSPPIAAVWSKEFHYVVRNGMSAVTFLLPPVMVFVFSMQFSGARPTMKSHGVSPHLFFPGMMAYLILILLSPAYNSFAFEGRGIQSYFMAPVRMRDVLVGKNLFLVCLVAVELSACLIVLIWRAGFPGWPLLLATIGAAAFAVAAQLTIANWSALSFPKKMEIGKMKGQRNSGIAVWTAFGAQIVIGVIAALVLFAGGWTGNPWLPAIAFAGLIAAALAGYSASLEPLNRLAEQKRELLIETLCR